VTRLLTENLAWKLAALVIASGLWYSFVGETELAASVPVTVQFKNVPSDLDVTSDQIDRIYLRLRGPATRLRAGSLTNLVVVFDLSQIHTEGEHTFTLDSTNLQLPPGVHVGRVVPSQVRLTFDNRVSREVPVEIRYAGPPPQGYRITGHHASPQKVRGSGREARVDHLQAAQTDAIDLSSTISNAEFRVPAFIPDPHIRFAGDPPIISVRVYMEKIPK
jgi:YbbR domain-containing protein